MKQAEHYHRDHVIAKVIVYLVYLLTGFANIELATPYIALVVGTFVWLFGVNTTAYVVECIAGHQHRHKLI